MLTSVLGLCDALSRLPISLLVQLWYHVKCLALSLKRGQLRYRSPQLIELLLVVEVGGHLLVGGGAVLVDQWVFFKFYYIVVLFVI